MAETLRAQVEALRDTACGNFVGMKYRGYDAAIDDVLALLSADPLPAGLSEEQVRLDSLKDAALEKKYATRPAAGVARLSEALQLALDWDAEYRAINNLGKGVPHWVAWAKESLGMVGHYAPAPPPAPGRKRKP